MAKKWGQMSWPVPAAISKSGLITKITRRKMVRSHRLRRSPDWCFRKTMCMIFPWRTALPVTWTANIWFTVLRFPVWQLHLIWIRWSWQKRKKSICMILWRFRSRRRILNWISRRPWFPTDFWKKRTMIRLLTSWMSWRISWKIPPTRLKIWKVRSANWKTAEKN